jgi:hypothetical protein
MRLEMANFLAYFLSLAYFWPNRNVGGQPSLKWPTFGQMAVLWPNKILGGQPVFKIAKFELFGHVRGQLATLIEVDRQI